MDDRLTELRDEYRRGIEQMVQLEQRRAELSRTLLRISGAIQVLDELRRGTRGDALASPTNDAAPAEERRMQVVGD
jgi:hypothetical protein